MSFNFTVKEFILGNGTGTPTFQFYRRGFNLGGSSGGSWTDIILKGNTSLTLTNAKANGLNYLKLFGGTEQRNLPDNYIQRQYIYITESSYLLTDIVPTPDCKIEFDFQTLTITSSARTYLGCRDTSGSNNGLRVAHVSSGNFRIYGFGTYTDSVATAQSNTRYKFVWDNKRATVTSGDTTIFDNTFDAEGTNQTAVAINGWNTAGTVDANSEGMYLYSFKVWNDQGNLIADYVPAVKKGTVPVVGFYDMVTGTFKEVTVGTFMAGAEAVPSPDTPMDIVSNNGTIMVSKNLCDMKTANIDLGHYISATGVYSESVSNFLYVPYIKVQPNTTYTLSFSEELYYITISEYSANDGTGFIQRNAGTTGGNTSLTVTTQATTQYIRFGSNPYGNNNTVTLEQVLAINWMLAKADTPQTYIPYGQIYTDGTVEKVEVDTTGDTATAEMLLKVGTYQDIQSVIDGEVTRKVGIKVLDGTEDWVKASNYTNIFYAPISGAYYNNTSAERIAVPCTHFVGTDATNTNMVDNSIKLTAQGSALTNPLIYIKASVSNNDLTTWQTWLATQYQNGTPVIVVFPLKTATTESVTAQPLTIQAGGNVVSITEASIDNLELEVSYKGTL